MSRKTLSKSIVLSLAVLLLSPALAETPILADVDPAQGWVDEDTRLTLSGEGFEPQVQPCHQTKRVEDRPFGEGFR